jgi:hypothetical protein
MRQISLYFQRTSKLNISIVRYLKILHQLEWLLNVEQDDGKREKSWSILRHHLGNRLDIMSKTMKAIDIVCFRADIEMETSRIQVRSDIA